MFGQIPELISNEILRENHDKMHAVIRAVILVMSQKPLKVLEIFLEKCLLLQGIKLLSRYSFVLFS